MTDFFTEFFIEPMINPAMQGYNLINTVSFITILVISCAIIYIVFKNKIKFDYNFLISLIPFILFGISMRVIMHQIEAGILIIEGITKTANPLELGFWFFTPGVWIITFSMVILALIISEVWKELKTRRLFFFGIIIATPILIFNFLQFNNWFSFITIGIFIFGISYATYFLVDKFTKYKIRSDKTNFLIILGQGFDGIASAIAIMFFNFSEQHVLSNILMEINPALFAGIKMLIAILLCYSLDDCSKEQKKVLEKQKIIKFIKIIIAILGLATGLASLFKLGIIN